MVFSATNSVLSALHLHAEGVFLESQDSGTIRKKEQVGPHMGLEAAVAAD